MKSVELTYQKIGSKIRPTDKTCYNIVPGGKAGEVPSGGFVPSFDGLGRFLGLSDDLGQIFYNSAKIATKEVFLNP